MSKRLIFEHSIPVEVYSQTQETNLKITINDDKVFEKTFVSGVRHDDVIQFVKTYNDGVKNKITFLWSLSGQKEDSNKHLIIRDIIINKQLVNVYNALYYPKIKKEWWAQLSDDEKSYYRTLIYGNAGKKFGWYGEIVFYYCTGYDYKSRYLYNKNYKDNKKILSEKASWIYLDLSYAKEYHRSTN
jgi:hypothetical protein